MKLNEKCSSDIPVLSRPYLNIKNTDWGLVLWVSFWMLGLVAFTLSIFMVPIYETIRFFFSWGLLPTAALEVTYMSNINHILNIFKVVGWIILIPVFLRYLFKLPKK